MNGISLRARKGLQSALNTWDAFWFTPTDPATLCAIRLLAGCMLFYTHLVWTMDLQSFFGPTGWLPSELLQEAQQGGYAWSHHHWLSSPAALWTAHLAALVVFALLTLGLWSRPVSILAYVIAISYAHRVTPGAFFGLDKINCMLAMYLMLGPCGARYSLDRYLALRRSGRREPPVPESVSANVAIRLIQLHMCIIYLFSGLGKLQGLTWWDGTAMWFSMANMEYQTLDLTWLLARMPKLTAMLTYVTVFWELFYVALVWQKAWRPAVLTVAVVVHTGIAVALGMITFGVAMLIGNLAFVAPATVRRWVERGG